MSDHHNPPSQSFNPSIAAAAVEQRVRQLPQQTSATELAAEHERRQSFRRLLDPGIVRPNSKEQASASIQTLLTIAENLLREPENPKYQQFKPTNNIIKRNLVHPKGALEYAIELGFRPEVKNFQPYYIFNPRRTADLRIGAAILREFINLENEKVEAAARSKVDRKAEDAARANLVKLAFMDDRRSKLLNDERERERRAACATAQATSPPVSTAAPSSVHTLNGDGPPPYES